MSMKRLKLNPSSCSASRVFLSRIRSCRSSIRSRDWLKERFVLPIGAKNPPNAKCRRFLHFRSPKQLHLRWLILRQSVTTRTVYPPPHPDHSQPARVLNSAEFRLRGQIVQFSTAWVEQPRGRWLLDLRSGSAPRTVALSPVHWCSVNCNRSDLGDWYSRPCRSELSRQTWRRKP
jgi:hypothetical protein